MECTHPNEMQPGLELVLAHTTHTHTEGTSSFPHATLAMILSAHFWGGQSWPGHKPGTELCLCVQMFVIYSVLSFKIKTHLFSLPSAVFRQRKSDASRKLFWGMAPRGLSSGLYNTISIRGEIPAAVVREGTPAISDAEFLWNYYSGSSTLYYRHYLADCVATLCFSSTLE